MISRCNDRIAIANGFERAAADAFHAELPGPAGAAESEARAVEIFLAAVLDGTRVRFA